jgi:hypothetical protein
MKKTQPPLSPFNSQPAVFARVCLPALWQAGLPVRTRDTKASLRPRRHEKSIRGNLKSHLQAILSLIEHFTLRCTAALQSA